MNKTAQTKFQRTFLIKGLPEPLTPASSHLQIFDNYIDNTRLRLRNTRDPQSKVWTRILQQRVDYVENEPSLIKSSEMHLNDAEYGLFERFLGRELRKNRYFHNFDNIEWKFDIYLGEARGIMIATADLNSREQMDAPIRQHFALIEITNDPFFAGEKLVEMKFGEIRAKLERLSSAERLEGLDPLD